MKNYIISDDKFEQLCKALNTPYCFEADGCDCGEFNFKIEENVYIYINRSCRKSNQTPEDMKWKLHKVKLAEKVEEEFDKYYELKDLKLDDCQRKHLEVLAMSRSIEDIGYGERGNEIITEKEKSIKDLTFKILEITTEKRIDGTTSIKAECVENSILLRITVFKAESNNKVLIKRKLSEACNRQLEFKSNDLIKVGDVL